VGQGPQQGLARAGQVARAPVAGRQQGVRDLDLQKNALMNAVRGVVRLSAGVEGSGDLAAKIEALKPAVEALASDADEGVRALARQGLERWRKSG
ncbi:MAG: hypothetical protein ACKOSS_00980, partial [Planctomycetia bacterium]